MRIISVVLCGVVAASVLGGCVSIQQQRSEAISAYQVGDYERAEELFKGVELRAPADAEMWYYRGAMAHSQKQYIRAYQCYEQSLRNKPGYRPAQNGLAQAAADLGLEKAERLRTNPDLFRAEQP